MKVKTLLMALVITFTLMPCQSICGEVVPEISSNEALVLEWMKQVQDISSPEQALLPSMEDNMAQTFNNALASMAFILNGERERAERILDFYSNATDIDNDEIKLQNFFYKKEPRGFFQFVVLRETYQHKAYHHPGNSDRWMGDMAWLLMAYLYYEKEYQSERYAEIMGLLKDLLLSFFKEDDFGGYVQHGWRKGDVRLHEDYGHHEGNIDAYAVFKLLGEEEKARKIKSWLYSELVEGESYPLDLFAWRALAFGEEAKDLLEFPENDPRYRKTMRVNGQEVVGFFSGPTDVDNIWVDGVGHMAAAYYAVNEKEKGDFYAGQMDYLLIERTINGVETKSLPYTPERSKGYEWVNPKRGFVSCAAWYFFAKHQFNPFTLKKAGS